MNHGFMKHQAFHQEIQPSQDLHVTLSFAPESTQIF